jgi:phosphoglycerate dehydrogenase-like enzyme
MRQIAHTPRLTQADAARDGVEAVALETLLRESDYLVVACPLTSATRGILDAGRIATMKPPASLINIGRGAVVDEAALTTALREGHLAAAALDVFQREPLDPSSPLLELENMADNPMRRRTR